MAASHSVPGAPGACRVAAASLAVPPQSQGKGGQAGREPKHEKWDLWAKSNSHSLLGAQLGSTSRAGKGWKQAAACKLASECSSLTHLQRCNGHLVCQAPPNHLSGDVHHAPGPRLACKQSEMPWSNEAHDRVRTQHF